MVDMINSAVDLTTDLKKIFLHVFLLGHFCAFVCASIWIFLLPQSVHDNLKYPTLLEILVKQS